MNRRGFLKRLAGGAAGLLALGAVRVGTIDPDETLAREAAEYRELVCKQGLDDPMNWRGRSPAVEFATRRGHYPPDRDGQDSARGACLTNGRLVEMIHRFNARTGGNSAGLRTDLIRQAQASPEYYRRLRAYFELDFRAGWVERHLAAHLPLAA